MVKLWFRLYLTILIDPCALESLRNSQICALTKLTMILADEEHVFMITFMKCLY